MSALHRQIKVTVSGREYLVEIADLDANPVIATVEGHSFEVFTDEGTLNKVAHKEDPHGAPAAAAAPPTPLPQPPKRPAPPDQTVAIEECYITAPMPGDILEILVAPGDQVSIGQEVCSLEAMKMKNAIRSPRAGAVKSIQVAPGQAVAYGDVLVVFE